MNLSQNLALTVNCSRLLVGLRISYSTNVFCGYLLFCCLLMTDLWPYSLHAAHFRVEYVTEITAESVNISVSASRKFMQHIIAKPLTHGERWRRKNWKSSENRPETVKERVGSQRLSDGEFQTTIDMATATEKARVSQRFAPLKLNLTLIRTLTLTPNSNPTNPCHLTMYGVHGKRKTRAVSS